MRQALRAGFTDAVDRSPIVIVLWQVNLLFGTIFAGLAATALAVSLDGSWYTRSLLYDLDATAFFALFTHHLATFKLLGATAVTLAVLYLAAWVPLYGAVVAAVCGDGDLGVRDALRAGAGVTPVFLRIGTIALIVFIVAIGGVGVATAAGMRLARAATAPGAYEAIAVAGLLVIVFVWIFCTAVHDHARIRCFVEGEGAIESYAWALSFVCRGRRRAYILALLLAAAGLVLTIFYQLVASRISADWMTGVVVSIVFGQAMLLARALVRVWWFAAEARLQGVAGQSGWLLEK